MAVDIFLLLIELIGPMGVEDLVLFLKFYLIAKYLIQLVWNVHTESKNILIKSVIIEVHYE